MASARWRIRRATTIETALIDLEVVTEEPKVRAKFATVDGGMLLASAFRSLADESRSMDLLTRYESRLRRIHKQAHSMLLQVRQQRHSEPAPPEPPPAPVPDRAPDCAPEACAPPTPAAPPPAIPLIPKPEARCRVGQAIRLPSSSKNKFLQKQNEPAMQRFLRRFRSRRERKIFNAASREAHRR